MNPIPMVILNEDSIIQCLQMEWIIQKKGLSPKVAKTQEVVARFVHLGYYVLGPAQPATPAEELRVREVHDVNPFTRADFGRPAG